jgi:RNA recognition motif. (a.k.a. RRM, RBD, or RNP domain)
MIADESVLRSYEYFGQYGKITKCVVNRSTVYTNHPQGPSYAAYITYSSQEEAGLCIKACDGISIQGRQLSLTFGTTKYCTYFLKNTQCPKIDCLYLHKMANKQNTIPREELPNKLLPQNCILEKINVVKLESNGSTILPSAKIVRDRTYSEITMPDLVPRPRLYSRDYCKSRFSFALENEDNSLILPNYISELVKKSSPCKDQTEVSFQSIEDIISPCSPDKWAKDIIEIIPTDFGEKCYIAPKVRT